MTNEKAITVSHPEGATRSPQEIVTIAKERADVLMKIVNDKQLFTMIGDKKHLDAEAWQIICAFDNAHLVPEWTQPILDGDGETVGYKARVNLLQHGAIIGAGEMSCGFEEFPCRGKEGMAKHRAAMSAAQTWAGAKAGRTKYAWVAVMAGFAPTPSEEMKGTEPDESQHYCKKHKTNWFMRGKMRNYAHPIEGSKEWCNEPARRDLAEAAITADGELLHTEDAPPDAQEGPSDPAKAQAAPQGKPEPATPPTALVERKERLQHFLDGWNRLPANTRSSLWARYRQWKTEFIGDRLPVEMNDEELQKAIDFCEKLEAPK